MMSSCRHAALLFCFIVAGCASVDTSREWAKTKAFATELSGIEARWEQSEEDKRLTETEIERLLGDGLSSDDAVAITLLNNRRLQAAFEEIGVAKANLVQAGLFTNPSLSAVFKFPFGGGQGKTDVDGLLNIADLWQIPLRKKVAEAHLEAALLRVRGEMVDTMSQAKHAYNDCAALLRRQDLALRLKRDLVDVKDHLEYRRRFGYTTDLDIYAAQASLIEQQMGLAKIERDLGAARHRLNRVMGLAPAQTDYRFSGGISDKVSDAPDTESLIAEALERRTDI